MGARGGGTGGGFVATGFSQAGLDYHYGKHKEDFIQHGKEISKHEYEKKAIKLLNSKIGDSIEGFTDKNGNVYRYNKDNNAFAKANPKGTIITFYKPGDTKKEGYKYWKDQIDKYSFY